MVIAESSTTYIHVDVTVPPGVDLSETPPRMAFLPSSPRRDNPGEDDWLTGEWGTGTTARILIGPDGAITLAEGSYRVWINVDPPGSEDVVLLTPAPLFVV